MSREREIRKELGFKENNLYHYCSIEALVGIVQSKSIWLTSLEFTNDKKELRTGKAALDNTLQNMQLDQKYSEIKSTLETISKAPSDKGYIKSKTNYHYYGASFVANKDSLTHWGRYGDGGHGACIALNIEMIKHYFTCLALPEMCTSWLRFDKIIYGDELQEQYIRDSIMTQIDEFSKHCDILKVPHLCNIIYYGVLAMAKPKFKHMGFLDEDEYRLVLEEGEAEAIATYYRRTAPETDVKKLFLNIAKHIEEAYTELKLRGEDKKFNIIGGSLRSYYAMNLSKIWGDALIPEVIIGPKCYQNRRELISFLKANDLYGTKVSISKIPIR